MTRQIHFARRAALAVALLASLAPPAMAQTDDGVPPPGRPQGARPGPGPGGPGPGAGPGQPQEQPRKRHHNSGVGAAIGAGVLGGIVGGALLNGQRQPDYPPPPPPPPPAAYDVEDEPVCRVVRKPVYDEDGEIVDYRTRRICR